MTAQTPVPPSPHRGGDDPSALATQQVWREIEHVTQLANTRFDAMDKAIALLQDFADRAPTVAVVHAELMSLKELMEIRFGENKTAVDAALASAEKLVSKDRENFSEASEKSQQSVTKELDAVKALIAANTKAVDDKIASLVLRLSEMNGQSAGIAKGWGWIVAVGGFILTVLTIVGALAAFFK